MIIFIYVKSFFVMLDAKNRPKFHGVSQRNKNGAFLRHGVA